MIRLSLVFAIVFLVQLVCPSSHGQSLVTYPAPENFPANKDYEVFVRAQGESKWLPLFVYSTKVNVRNASKSGQCAFTSFDANYSAPIEVRVKRKSGTGSSVKIRPDAQNVQFKKTDGAIEFKIAKAQKLSVEFDNDRLNNLMLFANNLETNVPDKKDPNVIYYGPGVHKVDNLKVRNGQVIYLHGGAVVKGSINLYGRNNVTVRGRGVLSGELLNHDRSKTRPNLLKFKNGTNITVEGITMIDSPVWSLFIDNCEKVVIKNVKVICYMINADGITLSQSKNVNVDNVFVRTADDNISIKSMNGGQCADITVKNSILWADDAHNMLVGPESKGATYQNIRFNNITVLENTQRSGMYAGVMSIMASDKATISGIYWDRITVEDITAGEIIRLNYTKVHSVEKDNYGNDIRDIHFSNITYNGQNAKPGSIRGINGSKRISNVSIKNFKVNNQSVTSEESQKPQHGLCAPLPPADRKFR
jgi:polygalacturonase